jgi:hypothetical protein
MNNNLAIDPDKERKQKQLCWRGPAVIYWTCKSVHQKLLVRSRRLVVSVMRAVAVGGWLWAWTKGIANVRNHYQATTAKM